MLPLAPSPRESQVRKKTSPFGKSQTPQTRGLRQPTCADKPFAPWPDASRRARGDFLSRLPAQLSFSDVHVDSGHVGGWEVEELYPYAEIGYDVSDHR